MPEARRERRKCAVEGCRAHPLRTGDRCLAHDEAARVSVSFGGPQKGAGRPARPKPHEVLRQRIEDDIDSWLQPLAEARSATTPDGRPDYSIRLAAAREAFDRVYGKPTQRSEVQHEGEMTIVELFAEKPSEATDSELDEEGE